MLTRRSVSHGDVPSCVCVLLHSCVPLLTLGEKNEGVRCSAVLSNMSVPTSCDRLMLVLRKFSSFLSSYLNQPLKANRKTILTTMTTHAGGDVQVIGLVPNIAHTAYTVHVKSKGIEPIDTFRVDCDLVARRLVLKGDGEPELYSVQSLKSVNLSPKAQSRRWVRSLVGWFFFCLSPFSASVFRK